MANLPITTSKQLVCLSIILALGLIAVSWKYFALLIYLSMGSEPYKNALFFRPCGHCRNTDAGINTVHLLEACEMPDRAMELVSAKAQSKIKKQSAIDISFYMTSIDKSGTISSGRWLELTSVYRNYLDKCFDRLERADTITKRDRDRFSWEERGLCWNLIQGLENHKLDLQCFYYFQRLLTASQKVNSVVDRTTLLKLCEFYSRHPELREGRDGTILLVKQALEHSEDKRQCKDRLYRKKSTTGKGYVYYFMCPCEQTIQPDPRSGVVCQCVCYQNDKSGIFYCCCEHQGFVLVSDGDYL